MPDFFDADGNPVEFDWETDDNPFVKRFNDYRSTADRKATEYAQREKLLSDLTSDDPDAQRAAAQSLGFDLELGEEPAGADPYTGLKSEFDQLKAELATERAQAAQAAEEQRVAQAVDAQLSAMDLSGDDAEWVLAGAIKLPPTENGLPDLKAAFEQLQARDLAAQERWRTSKRTPQVQRGKAGSEQKNMEDMSREERIEYVMAQHGMDD